jgi:hypothetical protein
MRPSQVHTNKALENISVAYMPQGLVAQDVSPVVPVEKESDIYYVYSKDNLRIPSTIWADGDVVNRSVWNLSTATYNLTRHGLDDLVTDRQKSNADKAIKPEIDMTEALTGQIKLRWEFDLFSIINNLTNWANRTSLSSTLVWTANTTLSNPITFVDSATTSIRRRSGKKANTIVLSDSTFKAAKEHVSIVDRIKYTSADSVTPGMLAGLFNVGKVVVSEAVKNDADEGIADSLSDIATDTAGIFYVEPSPGLKKPSAFYTFVKQGQTNPWRVRTYRDDPREGDVIEVSTFFQHKVVSSDCAYIINNCE